MNEKINSTGKEVAAVPLDWPYEELTCSKKMYILIGLSANVTGYELKRIICYTGGHYLNHIFDSGRWRTFDDSKIPK